MATVKFRITPKGKSLQTQIYLRFSIGRGKVLETKTGKTINPILWSSDTGKPKQNTPENKRLAAELTALSGFVLQSYNDDYSKGVIFNSEWLKGKISEFFNRIDEKADDSIFLNYLANFIEYKESISAYSVCSMRKFYNLKDRFSQFQAIKKKQFLIKEIDAKSIILFKAFLMTDCNLLETTATRFVKNLKTVIFDARHNGKEINHQIPGMSNGATNTEYKVFLSFAELEAIKKVHTLTPEWNLTRDWLIIGCYLGQRASDLLRMNKSMVYTKTDSDGNAFRFIELRQQKTGEKVVIPLHDEVENILQKYGGNFPPVFTDQADTNLTMFNRYLKKVCELAGIHDMVKGKVYNEILKKNEIVETAKCNLVSSHVCRRSFATNFYGNKLFTTPQLMAITGHKTETMFLNYIGKTADDWAMQTAKTFKELSNQKISG